MSLALTITIVALLVVVAAVILTGWRAWMFFPFRINPRRMTVERLRLIVRERDNVDRVDSILASFADGFNAMLTARSCDGAEAVCDARPSLLKPFAHEGLAMGYIPRALMRFEAERFEEQTARRRPEFRYLYYVGLGFWSGMRNHAPARVMRLVEGLDPLHRYLVFDGYGFKVAFFDAPESATALTRLDAFNGYARHAAWQGVGRALYFRFMDDADEMIEQIGACGAYAGDAAAGVGLASVFVNPDRIERAVALAERMPDAWRPHVHLGMCFGLKARSIGDVDQFERCLSRLDQRMQAAIRSSIRECDRVELVVRSEGFDEGYRVWRERVTAWMEGEIEYPLRGVRSDAEPGSGSASRQPHAAWSRANIRKGVTT